MEKVYKNSSRGVTRTSWLTSYHSFSFGNYIDYNNTNFGPLRVINDDIILPLGGFPTHPHRNMEIITLVLEGVLSHTDSTGKAEAIEYGEIQKMSAGSGILHSEVNNSDSESVRLLQIWIIPDKLEIEPSYQKIKFSPVIIKNTLFKIAGNKPDTPVYINQEAELFLSQYDKEKELTYSIQPGRQVYIHLINGEMKVGNNTLTDGDAIGVWEEEEIRIEFSKTTRFILFDLIL